MLVPRIFDDRVFDNFFEDFGFPFLSDKDRKKLEKKLYGRKGKDLMKTDIREKEEGYELDMDLPGFKKEEVHVTLENGYLTIHAEKGMEHENEKKKANYIRRERYTGACERIFYVGDDLKEEDIKGEFKHGVLKLYIPKKLEKPEVEEKKYITIE